MITEKAYRVIHSGEETCSFGKTHEVSHCEIKFLIRCKEECFEKMIVALNYNSDGIGTCHVAYDYQGRRYVRQPNWYGYDAWIRDGDKHRFSHHKPSGICFDILGKRI